MGACCIEMFAKPKEDAHPRKPKPPKDAEPETDRWLVKTTTKDEKTESVCGRGSNIEM